jgi:hypothetical protein
MWNELREGAELFSDLFRRPLHSRGINGGGQCAANPF